ncbi:MAG: cytochrome C assembly protein [Nitrospinota bacterium]|nr:MAG: cytochrome C assembly protein [Nitrospinota bacterium]
MPHIVLQITGLIALLSLLTGLALAFLYAPPDAVQGNVQRIMYIHVPMAWVAYQAFFVVFVSSIGYLWRKTRGWDRVAHASAELGVMFTGLAIIAGSVWGKPTWGTWWTWDARLTTTTILLLIYAAYLMLRTYSGGSERAARHAAVLGIIGFLDIPIIHYSVVWWRTLHQPPTVLRSGGPTIDSPMLLTLLLNVAAFSFFYLYLLLYRIEVARLKDLALVWRKER